MDTFFEIFHLLIKIQYPYTCKRFLERQEYANIIESTLNVMLKFLKGGKNTTIDEKKQRNLRSLEYIFQLKTEPL